MLGSLSLSGYGSSQGAGQAFDGANVVKREILPSGEACS